ncbi:MAG: HD domain-containing protein [archaeon]|nr:HD domain-containing protein [archaeon]
MGERFSKELNDLKKILKKFHPKTDLSVVEEAFYFSKKSHENQFRASGKPYFTHPYEVAKILAEEGLDEVIVSAALLHDVIEDTNASKKEIESLFGKKVAALVEGVTKLDILSFKSRQEYSTAAITKTVIAASKDLRILIIKIFDKLHNMRTIKYLPKEKQRRIAGDVMSIYVPLIHKLGMHEVKYELEELSFGILEPKKYKKMKSLIARERKKKLKVIHKATELIKKKFSKEKWEFSHETKSIYTHYSKMIGQNRQLSELTDYTILKIFVKNTYDCYTTMGKIHSIFKPIPYKVKDFIAIPEFGIYKALHTQVIGPLKKPLKIYIITKELDEIGEKGIVAYLKNNQTEEFKNFAESLPKLKTPGIKNNKELAETMNLEHHNNTMLVFTTKGESLTLPPEATALDFSCFTDGKNSYKSSAAKINGKLVPLWTQLKTGDRIKILYSNTSHLNSSWLSFVNSEKSKTVINQHLEKKRKPKNKKMKIARLRIECVDRPKLIMDQVTILAKNGLDIETSISRMNEDNTTCYSEFFIREQNMQNIQKAIKQLKKIPNTLNISLAYP